MIPEEQAAAATGWDAAVDHIATTSGYGWRDRYKGENPYRNGPTGNHVTPSNPNGSVLRCARRDLHEGHEWQADFGAYFNTYCPGNDGTKP